MALAVMVQDAPSALIARLDPRARPKARRAKKFLGTPRLSAVIVNYRQWRETGTLIRQLRAAACTRSGSTEVVVVDNHSPPHPLGARLRRTAGVSLRRWGRNRGFAAAANEGCRLSRGHWLLLLNPDLSISPDFLDRVLALVDRYTDEDSRAGIIGFQLRNSDGTLQLSSGFFPSLMGTLVGLAMPRSRRKYRVLPGGQQSRTCWVTGCCFLVRRQCWQELAGFDEDFFCYYEDVDFCRRARARGWSVWYEPRLQVVHYRPLHCRLVPAYLRVITRHALLTYGWRHWPAWQVSLLARIVQCEAWLKQHWAAWRRDSATATSFGELGKIASDLARGHAIAAGRRLQRLVRQQERRLDS